MKQATIELTSLTKHYKNTKALHQLNLSIQQGELFGLVGVNGAGKTTTLSIIMGFVRPTSGSAKVLGFDPWHAADKLHQKVAWLPGDVRLPDNISAKKWLEYQFAVADLPISRLPELAEFWEVPLERPMQTLSKGNRQKVALLRLLAADAALYILDEPSSGLDPIGQERLLAALRQRANAGATVLFSSHSLAEVQTLCDRVAVIDKGQVVQTGSVAALTGGTETLRVWTKNPLEITALSAWTTDLITPKHVVVQGHNLLEQALPQLQAYGIERAEFGGMGLEQLLERSHSTEVRT